MLAKYLFTMLIMTCMTRTTAVMELIAEFIAVPSSLLQPGNPEETLAVLTDMILITESTVTKVGKCR